MSDKKISKNVFILGLVSFFNDIASEMVYPIVPIFLSTVINAPVTAIGLIEGIAESTASLLKLISGFYSDKIKKRKPFTLVGYSLSSAAKIIIGVANSWAVVLVGRFTDRFGKGIRTSARDALIAESCDENTRGRAFGFHRAMDTSGAVIGPLAALFLIAHYGDNLRRIFFISFIPAVIGVLLLLFFVKEKISSCPTPTDGSRPLKLSLAGITPQFRIFLISSVVFAVGNSSDAFLILRAQNLGFTTTQAIMCYVLFNAVYALFSTPAGIISDKIGARKLLSLGFFFFAFIYLLFGIVTESHAYIIWVLFGLYGFYMAITEGIGKAYISTLAKEEKMATSMGIYQFSVGITTFFASLIAGFLWSYISPASAFIYGAGMSFAAGVLFITLNKSFDFQNPKL